MKFTLLTHRFWQPLRPWLRGFGVFKGKIGAGLFCALLAALSGVGLLALSGWFITASAFAGVLAFGLVFNIYIPGAGVRLFALLRTLARYFERLLQHDFILSLQSLWRVTLFKTLVSQPFEQQANTHTATQVQRLTGDLKSLENLWLGWISPTLVAAFSALLVTVLVAFWSFTLALFFVLSCMAMVLLLLRLSEYTASAQIRVYAQQEEIHRRAFDWLNSLSELTAWGLAKVHADKILAITEQQLQEKLETTAAAHRTKAILTALHSFVVFVTAAACAWLWQNQLISGPVAVLLPLAVLALNEVITPLAGQFAQAVQFRESAVALEASSTYDVDAISTSKIRFSQNNAIQLQDFKLAHNDRTLIDIDTFHIGSAEQITISAASGAGKSQFANRIVAAGRAQGVNIHYLTQQNYLFTGTLRQNLNFIRPDLTDEEAFHVLKQVDLLSWVMGSSDGLDTDLGEEASLVSGGQARRIALARLLLLDPQIVVLDEPFTGVDESTKRVILNRITPWLRGRTAIFFGHDQNVLPAAHRHYILYNQSLHPVNVTS